MFNVHGIYEVRKPEYYKLLYLDPTQSSVAGGVWSLLKTIVQNSLSDEKLRRSHEEINTSSGCGMVLLLNCYKLHFN